MNSLLRSSFRFVAIGGLAALAVNPAWSADDAAKSARVKAAHDAMLRATAFMESISADGGFLWNYSIDLKRRAGESPADENHIWMQPPGTPSVGTAFLRAYSATGDAAFLAAARGVAEALGKCQLESGGWHYSADMKHLEDSHDGQLDYKGRAFAAANPGKAINPLYTVSSNYDDDNTQSVVRFLIAYERATPATSEPRDRAVHAILDRALAGMLRAQYPNGAWPEQFEGEPRPAADFPIKHASLPKNPPAVWPHAHDYTHYYTLNDHTQRDCIAVMLEAWHLRHDARYLDSAKRGGDFLILAQLPEPQPGWAQQYNFQMEPAWARVFEPPGLVSFESGTAMQALIALHLETGDARYLAPLAPAVAWLERAQISPGVWARLYDLGADRPIYGDKDGKIYHDLNQISEERRTGYGWRGAFHLPGIIAQCRELEKLGRDRYLQLHPLTPPERTHKASAQEIDALVSSLDAEGRWIIEDAVAAEKHGPREKIISTEVFARNLETLSAYVDAFDRTAAGKK